MESCLHVAETKLCRLCKHSFLNGGVFKRHLNYNIWLSNRTCIILFCELTSLLVFFISTMDIENKSIGKSLFYIIYNIIYCIYTCPYKLLDVNIIMANYVL